jgi:CRISPR-associated protein Cmr3
MSRYLIKLIPGDTFFFSQENKYRKKRNGKIESDYYQRSAFFPQQTTVLGALRYTLLQKENQIPITNTGKAEELIGKLSFRIQENELKFGKIGKLSPGFIMNKSGKIYVKNPADLILDENEAKYLTKSDSLINSSIGDIPYFDNYQEKAGLSNFLYHSKKDFLPLEYDENEAPNGVFVPLEKIGITKNIRDKQGKRIDGKNSKAPEEGFYKQIFYRFNNNEYCFAFYANIDNDKLDGEKEYIVMGAERNPFIISFEKADENINLEQSIDFDSVNAPKIVLLSDAYIPDYNTGDFLFVISSNKTFRFLQTQVSDEKGYYSSDPLKKIKRARSDKFTLIEKGSVFYFSDDDKLQKFENKLKGENNGKVKNFFNIGYNHYKTIK